MSTLVRAGDPCPRAPPRRARRGDGASDGGVDGTTTPRSVPVERSPALSDSRSGHRVPRVDDDGRGVGVEEILTVPPSPWQNAYAERLIGSIRECLDQVIIANQRGLRQVVNAYLADYLKSRPHPALRPDAPVARPVARPADGRIVAIPHLGGLHHHYERRAA